VENEVWLWVFDALGLDLNRDTWFWVIDRLEEQVTGALTGEVDCGNFVSNGDTVYSYALLLAKWTNNGPEWVINPDVARTYSVTTARHVNALLRELPYK
jgi:hypothetical protein